MGKKGCFFRVGGLPEIGLEVRAGGGKLESGTEYSQSLKLMSHSFLWEKKETGHREWEREAVVDEIILINGSVLS